MLVFFNSNGVQTGTFFFSVNPPQGGLSVLIATTNLLSTRRPCAGHPHPPLISPGSGKVVFRGNPANPFHFDVNLALSYGTFLPILPRCRRAGTRVAHDWRAGQPHARPELRFQRDEPKRRFRAQRRSSGQHTWPDFRFPRGWTGD